MSRPRSYSTRTSPLITPSYLSNPAVERREQRRAVTTNITSSRESVLLSPSQLSKVSKTLAQYQSNPGTSSIISQISDYDPINIDYDQALHRNERSKRSSLISTSNAETLKTPSPSQSTRAPSTNQSIGKFPVRIQEYAVIEDLLYVLMGFNGIYIQFVFPTLDNDDDQMKDGFIDISPEDNGYWDAITYDIDPTLATYFVSVDAFIEQFSRYEYGTINHALCASIREFLKEYLIFIAQLEHQFQTSASFTLQRLWFYAQDTLGLMKVLHTLAMEIRFLRFLRRKGSETSGEFEAVLESLTPNNGEEEIRIPENQKGGAILNVLADRLVHFSGDPQCKKIYSFLLARASVPYFNILHSWIYHGEIKDTYDEFMIEEKKNVKKEDLREDLHDTYWEMRYTNRDDLVPTFLKPFQNKILLAGKYLNVVQECGINIAKPENMLDAMRNNDANTDTIRETTAIGEDQQSREGRTSQTTQHDGFATTTTTLDQNYASSRNEVWESVDGGSTRFVKSLEIAYKYANHTLLNMLLKEQKLIDRLRSLKHYFFLDQSDFLTSFLDLAKDELKQPAKEISLSRLQSLMDLVLRNPSSVAAYDPYKEGVRVVMSPLKLIDYLLKIISMEGLNSQSTRSRDRSWTTLSRFAESTPSLSHQSQTSAAASSSSASSSSQDILTGYDALTLDYAVTFPLSLVISRRALTKYQLLFRHLLHLKHVEELLCETWLDQKDLIWRKRSLNPDVERLKFRFFTLRSHMLAFVQQFAYYVTNEVLEPNWQQLESHLSKASTVDELLRYHSDFLDTCLTECMLTEAKLLRIYKKLMGICVTFAGYAERCGHLLKTIESQAEPNLFGISKNDLDASVMASLDNTSRALSSAEEVFYYHMKLLIKSLNDNHTEKEAVPFLPLVIRLDYNAYYDEWIRKDENRRRQ
ncbi:hypothetical protein EC973_000334 [Apophysomyces ossiformis]|uniref:Spindle pole body component n=1 Tax=Apophysomyces ossiformis TaxID=679940 RepID=A0A8H7BJC6_9FUNG|nr:hypothetical protein EC973_000334 [Apophysomyces ossiformis]